MKQALGVTPRLGEQIKTSRSAEVPHRHPSGLQQQGEAVLDQNGKPKEFHEQMTYPSGKQCLSE